jgi:hypothetical protein
MWGVGCQDGAPRLAAPAVANCGELSRAGVCWAPGDVHAILGPGALHGEVELIWVALLGLLFEGLRRTTHRRVRAAVATGRPQPLGPVAARSWRGCPRALMVFSFLWKLRARST